MDPIFIPPQIPLHRPRIPLSAPLLCSELLPGPPIFLDRTNIFEMGEGRGRPGAQMEAGCPTVWTPGLPRSGRPRAVRGSRPGNTGGLVCLRPPGVEQGRGYTFIECQYTPPLPYPRCIIYTTQVNHLLVVILTQLK